MAGDWIKVEENMPDKPEVCSIAARLGIETYARRLSLSQYAEILRSSGIKVQGVEAQMELPA